MNNETDDIFDYNKCSEINCKYAIEDYGWLEDCIESGTEECWQHCGAKVGDFCSRLNKVIGMQIGGYKDYV